MFDRRCCILRITLRERERKSKFVDFFSQLYLGDGFVPQNFQIVSFSAIQDAMMLLQCIQCFFCKVQCDPRHQCEARTAQVFLPASICKVFVDVL